MYVHFSVLYCVLKWCEEIIDSEAVNEINTVA